MTLFASIFFFVNTFPKPPAEPTDQFAATLQYNPAATQIIGVSVTHLSGSILTSNTLIYIASANHPKNIPSSGFPLAPGLGGSTNWNLGQTWTKNISSYSITVPDNLTVSILSGLQLLYRVTLPGISPNIPPTFTASGTSPSPVPIGSPFTVLTTISDDDLAANSVFVNIGQLPGVSTPFLFQMSHNAVTGQWYYNVPSTDANLAGTFFVFVNATDLIGQQNSVAIPVVISSSSTTGSGGASFVGLALNTSVPVIGSPLVLSAQVTNPTGATQAITVIFTQNGVKIGSTISGSVAAGSTGVFNATYTPPTPGTYVFAANASEANVGSGTVAQSVTVFPRILLLSHNVVAGTNPSSSNTSALLAEEMTSDGFPFHEAFLSCSSNIAAATISGYDLVVIDYGSRTGPPGCTSGPSATDEATITGSSADFFLVGEDAFNGALCANYTSAFAAQFGFKTTNGASCGTAVTTNGSATYTSPTAAFRADGVPSSLFLNKTILGTSFKPYAYFTQGVTLTSWLTIGGKPVGSYATGTTDDVALATDPALLTNQIPNGRDWGTGYAGAAVVWNVLNWLCDFSTASSPGRALTDFGVAGVTLAGTVSSSLTHVYAGVRDNGPTGGIVTATLFVNGGPAYYGGQVVSVVVSLSSNGYGTMVSFVWESAGAASYTFSVVLTSAPGDLYAPDNQQQYLITSQTVTFT